MAVGVGVTVGVLVAAATAVGEGVLLGVVEGASVAGKVASAGGFVKEYQADISHRILTVVVRKSGAFLKGYYIHAIGFD